MALMVRISPTLLRATNGASEGVNTGEVGSKWLCLYFDWEARSLLVRLFGPAPAFIKM